MTRYVSLPILFVAAGLVACGTAGTGTTSTGATSTKSGTTSKNVGGKLYVQTPARYDKDAAIKTNDKVRAECAIENKVSYFIQERAKSNFEVVPSKTLADAGKNRALSLSILKIEGVSGGAWSGPKAVTIQGALRENGKVVGTFTARRTSGGGAFGAYKSTCGIFERTTEALGKDVAAWLAAPGMGAQLGELK